ncbi:uncharacterized protein [Palaemon carinicauda]|uniref:uncharacterized protein isoform X2 n=1 Tax=Palaemon carinicauda TaxID=392227 RepID=UPI0035B5E8CA
MFLFHSTSAFGVAVLTLSLWPGISYACPTFKDISNGSFRCDVECMTQNTKSVYGTLIYGEDSDACLAGLHAGALGLNGGTLVTQQRDAPERVIQGTCRNRVCSSTFKPSGAVYTVGNGTLITDKVRGDVLLIHNSYQNKPLSVLCLSEDSANILSPDSIRRWNYGSIGTPEGILKSPSKVITTSSASENRHAVRCLGKSPASDILSPIIFPDADYKTTQYTFRASKGDALQVRFSPPDALPQNTGIVRFPDSRPAKPSLNYTNVQPDVTGLYNVGHGKSGAYFNIIIRDCEAGKYGVKCQNACPDCKNGGECHSYTGECICPPGFTGELCQKACPKGYIGNDCKLQCSEKELYFPLPVKDSCEGLTFCLPDPLGCTCAAGYKGVLCDQPCDLGEYGAECIGSCQEKCQTNDCDPVTGKCPPSLPKNIEINVAYPKSLNLSWQSTDEDTDEHQDKLYYHVAYKLLTRMSCNYEPRKEEWNRIIEENQPIVISGLEAHASYNVCLSIYRESDSRQTVEKCNIAETGIEVPTLNVTELVCTPNDTESIMCYAKIDGTCDHYNGPKAELSFTLSYDDCDGNNTLIEEPESLSPDINQFHSGIINHTFSGLIPGLRFLPAVQVKQVPVPELKFADPVYTEEKAPPPVNDLKVVRWNETDVKVMWNAPCPSNGKIVGYKISTKGKVYEISTEDDPNCSGTNGYEYCSLISHLERDATYKAQITVETSNFQSQEYEFNLTTLAKPGQPVFREGKPYKDSLDITIAPPSLTGGGRLTNCTVAGPKDSCVIPIQEKNETMTCEIKNLASGTNYSLEVYCCNAMFCGERVAFSMSTRPFPVFQGSVQAKGTISNSTIALNLPKLINTGETKTNLVIVVERLKKDGYSQRHDLRNESTKLLINYMRSRQGKKENSQEKPFCGDSTWIAAMLPVTHGNIEVGDGNTYGGFKNCPLEHGESYSVGVLGITYMQGEPEYQEMAWQQLKEPVTLSTQDESDTRLLMLVILCVESVLIVLIVMALIVMLYRRCLAKKEEDAVVMFKKETSGTAEGGHESPIKTDD